MGCSHLSPVSLFRLLWQKVFSYFENWKNSQTGSQGQHKSLPCILLMELRKADLEQLCFGGLFLSPAPVLVSVLLGVSREVGSWGGRRISNFPM